MNAAATRVALVFMAQRINAYLRFGDPVHLRIIDERRRVAEFAPGAIFCRILWQANDFGTTRWELAVMQAMHRGEPMQHVTGVVPGARLLLQAEGGRNVQAVLRLIDAIEAQRIDPADVAPRYWQAMNNRLWANIEMAVYGSDRHAAHVARRAME